MRLTRTAFALLALTLALATASAWAGDALTLESAGGREAVVKLGSQQVRLTVTKIWTRMPDGRTVVAEGERIAPVQVAASGPDEVEMVLAAPSNVARSGVIARVELDVSAAADWQDADGTRTLVRRGPNWLSTAKMLLPVGAFPAQWAWPTASGSTGVTGKASSAMGVHEIFTGCSSEILTTQPARVSMLDTCVVGRISRDGRSTLALSADFGLFVRYEGAGKLVVYPANRWLPADRPADLRVRLALLRDGGAGLQPAAALSAFEDRVSPPLRVVFLGDSVGATAGGYAQILAARLNEVHRSSVHCMNVSIGGSTTTSALARYRDDVLDYRPNLVVIQLCYNDVGRLKPELVVANLKKMIAPITTQPAGRVVLFTPLRWDKKDVDAGAGKVNGMTRDELDTKIYIPALEGLARELEADPATKGRVALVNIWQAMSSIRETKGEDYGLMKDGASHPGIEGHTLIANAAWPVLRKAAEDVLKGTEK